MQQSTYRWYIFAVTFLNYAAIYATRSTYSYNKPYFQQDMGVTDDFLGTLDMFFLLALAFSYIFLCDYAKKMEIKYFLCLGVIPAALSFLCYPIFDFLNLDSKVLLILIMFLSGMFQAFVWPSLLGIMGNWFSRGNRGFLMGLWSTNQNFGNIIGMQVCHMVIFTYGDRWTTCFMITGCLLLYLGVFNLFFLESSPAEAGYKQIKDEQPKQQIQEIKPEDLDQQQQPQQQNLSQQQQLQQQNNNEQFDLNFKTAWSVPGVLIYAICFSCIKGTNYGLLFWLPKYLNAIDLMYYSAAITQIMQVGALFGGIVGGQISDMLGKRAVVLVPMIFIAALCMWLFVVQTGQQIWVYYILIFIIGSCLFGSNNIIGAAVSIDLGEQPMLKHIKNASARISSLIEGTSAIFAAMIQRIIPIFGAENVFYVFAIGCFIGGLTLIPVIFDEFSQSNKLKKNKDSNKNQ